MLDRSKNRWEKLKYWQKGAIIGGGLHLGIVFLIGLIAFTANTFLPNKISDDFGRTIPWMMFILYGVLEFLPIRLLSLVTGINSVSDPSLDWNWFIILTYSTLFYALIGIITAKLIQLPNRLNIKNRDV